MVSKVGLGTLGGAENNCADAEIKYYDLCLCLLMYSLDFLYIFYNIMEWFSSKCLSFIKIIYCTGRCMLKIC